MFSGREHERGDIRTFSECCYRSPLVGCSAENVGGVHGEHGVGWRGSAFDKKAFYDGDGSIKFGTEEDTSADGASDGEDEDIPTIVVGIEG